MAKMLLLPILLTKFTNLIRPSPVHLTLAFCFDNNTALEACNHVQCSFTIRVLDDHDSLLGSISGKGNLVLLNFHGSAE